MLGRDLTQHPSDLTPSLFYNFKLDFLDNDGAYDTDDGFDGAGSCFSTKRGLENRIRGCGIKANTADNIYHAVLPGRMGSNSLLGFAESGQPCGL